MVVAALDAVEKAVAEVMVEGDAASRQARASRSAARSGQFDASGVKTLWEVARLAAPR